MTRLDELLLRIEDLEKELAEELRLRQERFLAEAREKKIRFGAEVRARQRELASTVSRYVLESGPLIILTIPVIWGALLPALLLDLTVTVYQAICFPIYGIPRVRRRDHLVIDRHALAYLNVIEKLNCVYCGYFNGLLGFMREVAARTEQYWCPIRHARPVRSAHGRYRKFLDYGDAEAYRERLEEVRHDFKDLEQGK